MLTKQIKLKHGISELGNLQIYPITEIVKDKEVVSFIRGQPYTPSNINNLEGFDDRSKEIVSAIITPRVKKDFEAEKQKITGVGIEEVVSYDRTVEEDGKIAVRKITRIFDEGKEINKKYHRSWIMPGDNPNNNDVISRALARKIHTPKTIKAYKEKARQNIGTKTNLPL